MRLFLDVIIGSLLGAAACWLLLVLVLIGSGHMRIWL